MTSQGSLPDSHGRRMIFSPYRLRKQLIRDAFSQLGFVGAVVSAAESIIGYHYAYETDVLVLGNNRFLNSIAAYLLGMQGIRVVVADAVGDDSVPWNEAILNQHAFRVLIERTCLVGSAGVDTDEWVESLFSSMPERLAVHGENSVFTLDSLLSPEAYAVTDDGFLVNVKARPGGCGSGRFGGFVSRIPALRFPQVGKRCQRFLFAKRIVVTSQVKGFFPCLAKPCEGSKDRVFVYETPKVYPVGAASSFPGSFESAMCQPVIDIMFLREFVLGLTEPASMPA